MTEFPSIGVASFYAAILSVIFIKLTLDVINLRSLERTPIGSEGSEELKRAMAAQSNFAVSSLWVMALLILADYAGIWALLLHITMIAFVASRILHIYSVTKYEQQTGSYGLRKLGMMITFAVIAVLSVMNFYISIFG